MADSPDKYVRNHILPENPNTINLGESGREFKNLNAQTVITGSLTVNGVDVSAVGAVETDGTPGTGVAAAENAQIVRQTTLILTDVVVPVVSITSGAGIGGVTIFTFPAGDLAILGTTATLTMTVPTGEQADFTDATPEGDWGLGSAIITDPTAFSTDATDDDYCAGAAFDMDSFAVEGTFTSQPIQQQSAIGSEKLNVNVFVDAGDIDDDATTSVLISGTVTVTWANIGAV